MQLWTGRREKRTAKVVRVTGHWSHGPSLPEGTHTENVSQGGARIVTPGELRLGGTVEIRSTDGEIHLRGRVVYCQMLLDGKFAAGLEKRAEDFKGTETERPSKSASRRGNDRSVLGGSGKKARWLLRVSVRFLKRLCRADIATGESSSPAGEPPRGTSAPYRAGIGRAGGFRFRRALPGEAQESILRRWYSGLSNLIPGRRSAVLDRSWLRSPGLRDRASFPCDVRNKAAGDYLLADSKAYNLPLKHPQRASSESVHTPNLADGKLRNAPLRNFISSRGASCQRFRALVGQVGRPVRDGR